MLQKQILLLEKAEPPHVGAERERVMPDSVVGYIEFASAQVARGWAVDRHAKGPVKIDIYYDGQYFGTTFAGHARTDVHKDHGVMEAGFYFVMPVTIPAFAYERLAVLAGDVRLPVAPHVALSATSFDKPNGASASNTNEALRKKTGEDSRLTLYKVLSEQIGLQQPELLTEMHIKKNNYQHFEFKKRLAHINGAAGAGRLAPWVHHFDFADGATDQFPHLYDGDASEARHGRRSDMITQTIHNIYGDKIRDMTVLDVGCNCGIFSFDMASIGAKRVVGIDVFDRNIEQAKYLHGLLGYKNVEFHKANMKDFRCENFDIVLNLGVMYHLSTPYEVMKWCQETAKELCVVDTLCHRDMFSGFFSVYKQDRESGTEGDAVFELQPTYSAIVELIAMVGFKRTVEIVSSDFRLMALYDTFVRRCFFCFNSSAAIDFPRIKDIDCPPTDEAETLKAVFGAVGRG